MQFLKKVMCWIFACTSFLAIWAGYLFFLNTVQIQRLCLVSKPWILLVDSIFPLMTILFAATWWSTLTKKYSARVWGIAASLICILLPVWSIINHRGAVSSGHWVELAIGAAGLTAFSRRSQNFSKTDNLEPVHHSS
jgi:hypothetical protein